MDEQETGWEGDGSLPKLTDISIDDYIMVGGDVSRRIAGEIGLSLDKSYMALNLLTSALTGGLYVEIINDAGKREPYPAEMFEKAPAEKALMLIFPRHGWMDGSADSPCGKYVVARALPGAAFTDERPDTKAFDTKPRAFNPNDFHPPPIAQAYGDMQPKDRKENWKANARNLPLYSEKGMFIYGVSKEATVDGSLDPDLLRNIDITPGETYKVSGYVDSFMGGKGVTIVNDAGKEMTYRESLFRQ